MAGATDTHVEREVKFDVPDGFEVPDLEAAAQRLVPGATVTTSVVHLTSTYYDTADHDLLRQRMTLRKREGDDDTGWHLKVPNDLARTEIHVPLAGGRRAVPGKLAQLVRGVALGAPLGQVAVLETERHRTQVQDSDGRLVVEIADDHVRATATGASTTVSTWREAEIELGDSLSASEDVLAAFGRCLQDAGATESASTSKLARALGDMPGATKHADGQAGGNGKAKPTAKKGGKSAAKNADGKRTKAKAAGPDITVASALAGYLQQQFDALSAGDVGLRRDLDVVHKTRVAARRARSALRVFAPVLEPERTGALEQELSWYQHLLGRVRDSEVQRELLVSAVQELPAELTLGPVAGQVERALLRERLAAVKQVRDALDSERYFQLLRDLRDFAADPPIDGTATAKDLRRLAAEARSTAAKRLDTATSGVVDPIELHRARKATKRARYATELVATLGGKHDTEKTIKRQEDVQAVLGDHQDAVVAAENLRRLGVSAGARAGHNGFTYGLLYERQLARQQELRRKIARFDL